MTVTVVHGDQVNCSWTDWNGELKSENFPIGALSAGLTLPPDEPNMAQDERAADQYYQQHCPSGSLSLNGKFQCAY